MRGHCQCCAPTGDPIHTWCSTSWGRWYSAPPTSLAACGDSSRGLLWGSLGPGVSCVLCCHFFAPWRPYCPVYDRNKFVCYDMSVRFMSTHVVNILSFRLYMSHFPTRLVSSKKKNSFHDFCPTFRELSHQNDKWQNDKWQETNGMKVADRSGSCQRHIFFCFSVLKMSWRWCQYNCFGRCSDRQKNKTAEVLGTSISPRQCRFGQYLCSLKATRDAFREILKHSLTHLEN